MTAVLTWPIRRLTVLVRAAHLRMQIASADFDAMVHDHDAKAHARYAEHLPKQAAEDRKRAQQLRCELATLTGSM